MAERLQELHDSQDEDAREFKALISAVLGPRIMIVALVLGAAAVLFLR